MNNLAPEAKVIVLFLIALLITVITIDQTDHPRIITPADAGIISVIP